MDETPRPVPADGRGVSRAPDLVPYLPRLAVEWGQHCREQRWRAIDGTLVFVDISGFTALSERLATRGRAGGEELTEVLGTCFAELLAVAYAAGGSLIKFGGDALLLLFDGEGHAHRGAMSAIRMRETMSRAGRLSTSVGAVRLRMSVGVHSGVVHAFRVGRSHKELLLTGPAASAAVAMESAADAGEILASPATAALLPAGFLGAVKGDGVLLRRKRSLADDTETFIPGPDADVDVGDAIPVALRDHLRSRAVESEHRHATIAFLHFDGTDGLLASAGPDAVATALDELVSDVQDATAAYDVTFLASDIDRDGGKIILAGGAPTATEDDSGQVLHALHRIARGERRLPVRIGVNRGHVFAGEVGPHYRRTYTVMGDAVNLAARLMAKAEPGQVLATAGVVELARTRFELAPLPPFHVKGKTAPVEAFAVGDPLGSRGDWGMAAALPFTGRDAELSQLMAALDGACAGRGSFVEVSGESGIGKSRLVDELRRRADGVRSLQIVCEPYEMRTPYYAMRPLLNALLGLDGPPDADSLGAAVAAVDPRFLPWLPLLGDAFGLELPATDATAELAPKFRRERTNWLLAELMELLVPEPTILAFDDAQWMDDSSCAAVHTLARRAPAQPWLICVLRSEGEGGCSSDAAATTRIALPPLDDDAANHLVAAASVRAPLPVHRRQALVARAGGNPLFLGELLLRSEDDDEGALPETLEGLVAAQIDRLAGDSRRLLRHAAVLGMVFDTNVLAAVVDPDLEQVARDARRHLGPFVEPIGRSRLRFRNQCTRDVAYETLPYRRRRELHGRAAATIEAQSARPTDKAEVLSLHYLHAQDYERCWRYSGVGVERAAARYANLEAAELCERALAAGARLADLPSDALAAMWERLADISTTAGVYDRARGALARARRLRAGQSADLARLYFKEATLADRRGSPSARWVGRGLALVEGSDAPGDVEIRTTLRVKRAQDHQQAGRHRQALRWVQEAVDEARASGNRKALAQAYQVLDWVHISMGRRDLAAHGPEALAIWEELGELSNQAILLNNLGAFAYYEGKWDTALDYYRRARDACTRVGNAADAGLCTCNIAEILIDQGRLDEAEPALRETAELWRSLGYGAAVAVANRFLGRIAVKRGDLDEADRLLDEARQVFAAQGAGAKVLEVDTWRAECLLRRGQPEQALVLINDALHREHSSGDTTMAPMLHRLRAYALAALDRLADAWGEVDESLHVARERGASFEVALALEALAVLTQLGGLAVDQSTERERADLLADLGVAVTPAPPLVALLPTG